MGVSEAKRLKALEVEAGEAIDPVDRLSGGTNAQLKKLLAEQMMDVATLREMHGKNF